MLSVSRASPADGSAGPHVLTKTVETAVHTGFAWTRTSWHFIFSCVGPVSFWGRHVEVVRLLIQTSEVTRLFFFRIFEIALYSFYITENYF
jgi:hypothetical protein